MPSRICHLSASLFAARKDTCILKYKKTFCYVTLLPFDQSLNSEKALDGIPERQQQQNVSGKIRELNKQTNWCSVAFLRFTKRNFEGCTTSVLTGAASKSQKLHSILISVVRLKKSNPRECDPLNILTGDICLSQLPQTLILAAQGFAISKPWSRTT